MKYIYTLLTALLTTALLAQPAERLGKDKLDDGIKYFLDGDYTRAISSYTDAIQTDSTYSAAYFERAKTYQKTSQVDKAIGDYTLGLIYDARNVNALLQRGNLLLSKELYENAIGDFDKAIKIDSNNANAYLVRATAKVSMGEPGNAIPDYTKAINKGKKTQVVYYQRGKAKENIGLTMDAIADYTESIKIAPSYELALISRGILYYTLMDYDNALKDLNGYIAKKAGDGKGYFYRARIYEAKHDNKAACKDYDKAIANKYLNAKEKPAICP